MPDESKPAGWSDSLLRGVARLPASLLTYYPALAAGVGKAVTSELPASVQRWLLARSGVPESNLEGWTPKPGLAEKAADAYRENVEKVWSSDMPTMEKAQKSASGLAAGLWGQGETMAGFHDYPGDDKAIDVSLAGAANELGNFAKGRTNAMGDLVGAAVGVPASMTAGLVSDVATGTPRTLSTDPAGVGMTFAPLALKGLRGVRGKLSGGDAAVLTHGEPTTMPLAHRPVVGWKPPFGDPTVEGWKPQYRQNTPIAEPSPVEPAMAAKLIPIAKDLVARGAMSAGQAAATLERAIPWQAIRSGDLLGAIDGMPEVAGRMAKGAALGVALGGDPFGTAVAATVGAVAPEAVRALWRAMDPETRATVIRKIGGRGSRYQQATPEETEFTKGVVEDTHARGEGLRNLGMAAQGEMLRSQPVPDLTSVRRPAPQIATELQDITVDPDGTPHIVPRERVVADAVVPAEELAQRRIEAQVLPELQKELNTRAPGFAADTQALADATNLAQARKGQIGNTQKAFERNQGFNRLGPERELPSQTTSPAYNAHADEVARLGQELPTEVPEHWWRNAAIEVAVDPRSPKLLNSARIRGAVVQRITHGLDKKVAAKLTPMLDEELVKMSSTAIGPEPLSAEFKLPDGRIVDVGDVLQSIKDAPPADKPGLFQRGPWAKAPLTPEQVYREMQAEAVGGTYKAYGLKMGEVQTRQLIEAEGLRPGGQLEQGNPTLLAKAFVANRGKMPFQVLHADPVAAAKQLRTSPATFGLTPEEGHQMADRITRDYVPTPRLAEKFMGRQDVAGGAQTWMKKGFADSIEEHLAVNYLNEELSGWDKKWTELSRTVKENLTAMSVSTKFANDAANATVQFADRGMTPYEYQQQVLRKVPERWGAIAHGAPASAYELQRQRSLLKTGKLETDMMAIEAKRNTKFGPTSGGAVAKVKRWAKEKYSTSDAYPKLEEGIHNYDQMFDDLSKLANGKEYKGLVGPNNVATFKRVNGILELNGKPLVPEALSDIVARMAMQTALEKFVDHGDANLLTSALRRGTVTGVITPFITWKTAVLDVPGLKKGLLGSVLQGGPSVWTNDPAIARVQWERMIKQTLRRAAINGMAFDSVGAHDDDSLLRKPGRAISPVVRSMLGDPMGETMYDLARYDWMAPSMTLFRVGARSAWEARFAVDGWQKDAFPELDRKTDKMGKVGDPSVGNPKFLRAWLELQTGKGTFNDAMDVIGFGGGVLAPVLRQFYKGGSDQDLGGMAWTLSRAIVGGTPSDLVNATLAAYYPELSSRKRSSNPNWSGAAPNLVPPHQWEDMVGFILRRTVGLGLSSVNTLDAANEFIGKASSQLHKTLVDPLQNDASGAAAHFKDVEAQFGKMSPQAQEAKVEMDDAYHAVAFAESQVGLVMAHYQKRLAALLKTKRSAVALPDSGDLDIRSAEDKADADVKDILAPTSEPTEAP